MRDGIAERTSLHSIYRLLLIHKEDSSVSQLDQAIKMTKVCTIGHCLVKLFTHRYLRVLTTFDYVIEGSFFLADAGYKLYSHIMTPFKIHDAMTRDESHYNYYHSKARMAVECAFGVWKQVFRLFNRKLNHANADSMAEFITASMVLHNWRIDLGEDVVDRVEDRVEVGRGDGDVMNAIDGPAAVAVRNRLKEFICNKFY